ncbi:MAG: DUF4249 domain-containing protein [Bacteroidales bacterium]|jgi:hypothetical protein|nr:DUF4249 domain-containing protein [Bacteroidales bacterium]
MVLRLGFKSINIALLACLFISSCTERININLNNIPPCLVVDGSITPDTVAHRLLLTRTTDYYNPDLSNLGIAGATVYVIENGGDSSGSERVIPYHEVGNGLYTSDSNFFGTEGKTYTLHISNVDVDQDGETEEYTASEMMPYVFARFDSVSAVYGPGLPPLFDGRPGPGWNILLYGQDPPETREYYGFMLTINDTSFDAHLLEMFLMSDDIIQGAYIPGMPLYFFSDDGRRPLKQGDIIKMEGVSITQKFSTYITMLQNIGGIPLFGGPPSNVKGNISGNALGYFSVYSNRKASTVLQ